MMPPTRDGIYHNLLESEYVVTNGVITFYFSSEFYMDKYLEEYKKQRDLFNKRVKYTIKDSPFDLNLLSDIVLYKAVEKRGFRAKIKGVETSWQGLHRFVLEKKIKENTKDWLKIPKKK